MTNSMDENELSYWDSYQNQYSPAAYDCFDSSNYYEALRKSFSFSISDSIASSRNSGGFDRSKPEKAKLEPHQHVNIVNPAVFKTGLVEDKAANFSDNGSSSFESYDSDLEDSYYLSNDFSFKNNDYRSSPKHGGYSKSPLGQSKPSLRRWLNPEEYGQTSTNQKQTSNSKSNSSSRLSPFIKNIQVNDTCFHSSHKKKYISPFHVDKLYHISSLSKPISLTISDYDNSKNINEKPRFSHNTNPDPTKLFVNDGNNKSDFNQHQQQGNSNLNPKSPKHHNIENSCKVSSNKLYSKTHFTHAQIETQLEDPPQLHNQSALSSPVDPLALTARLNFLKHSIDQMNRLRGFED
ncbi:hypothetical protein BB560_004962 [Smittium megazygosporum]|uniref:Uncharacterized protein n=1 Tax=Smittium megazygosporum TaxID=133381 RepID=A0A2T9Z7S3_9FUNG|nr:hypothetical protein BB560_004962 [Smittium megazygosporum]